jgi:uncharacterized RDD family membrane protein YckC
MRDRAVGLQGTRAGVVSRIGADAIDLGIVFLLYFSALVTFAVVRYLATSHSLDIPQGTPLVNAIAIFCVQVAYLTAGWSGARRTVGKAIVGLRVVTDKGTNVSWPRGFVRAVVCSVIGQPLLLWAAVSPRNAALYDGPLHTAVIYQWYPAKSRA